MLDVGSRQGRFSARIILWAVLMLALVVAGDAWAAADDTEARFGRAAAALEKNLADRAILELEALADRGVRHPDVSYDRGLAYAMRARSDHATPGDLGRAAAAFEEALRLRASDGEAARALDLVRAEIARRRSRQDKSDPIVRPSLDRVLLSLLSPAGWAIAAMGTSALLAIGLLLRKRPAGALHIAGSVMTPITLLALLGLIPAASAAKWLEETRGAGVVVAPEASMRDAKGQPVSAPAVPEGTLLEVGERDDASLFVRWGSYEGWVPATSVLVLVK